MLVWGPQFSCPTGFTPTEHAAPMQRRRRLVVPAASSAMTMTGKLRPPARMQRARLCAVFGACAPLCRATATCCLTHP